MIMHKRAPRTPVGMKVPSKPESRDAQALFEKLFACSPDAIVVVNSEGRILEANPQVESLFGYASSELLGCLVEILIPDRFRSVHATHRSAYNERPSMRPMGSGLQLYGKRKDGTEFPVDIMISPVETADGKLVLESSATLRNRSGWRRNCGRLLGLIPSLVSATTAV